MSATGFASAIALAASLAAGVGVTAAAAQDLPFPAEVPPASFTGTQYVDSKGCAFVRAGMDGRVNWIPRVDRARNQLCNFQPTGVTRTAEAPRPDPLPDVPIVTVTATPAPVAAPVAAPEVRTPAKAPRVAAAPQVRAPRPAPAVTVRAAPVKAAPVTPRVVVAAAPPAPRRVTLAEACEGRTGIQPGFISATTRQPIDCGGAAPVAVAAAQPRVTATPPATGPAPLRLTLAEACARQALTGQTLINAATRQPIACADSAPVAFAAMPQVRAATPAPQLATACGIDGFTTDGRYPVRCGPQAQSPSGGVQVARAAPLVTTGVPSATVATKTTRPVFGAGPVPASNAPVAVAQASVPRGYARVWDDGRINPQRGLKQPQVQVAARVSSRSVAPAGVQAPAAATTGHRYVQVGSFGDPANAARLIARLQAAGLPVASARSGGLKVIAAGPFRSAADLNRALGTVRGMGFADAYLRS